MYNDYTGFTGYGQTSKPKMQGINLPLLFITAAVGVLTWLLGLIVYRALIDSASRTVLIGVVFAILTAPLLLTVYFYSKFTDTFDEAPIRAFDGTWKMLLLIALSCAAVFLGAMILQWIYGLNGSREATQPTSYIFVIDDSGSMADNDPYQKRFSAIPTVLENMPDDFKFMVYCFSNGTTIMKGMGPKSEGAQIIQGYNSGGTEINGALMKVISDYENSVWDGGAAPRVVMLTDGYATDIGYINQINGVLKKYSASGISISTVGLGTVDERLMSKIAKSTGGVFIDVNDADELSRAISQAAVNNADRDLLSYRYMPKLNWLYGIMRVVFLAILGTLIGFACYLAYGSADSFKLIMISSAIKSLAGSIILEIGVNAVGISESIMWLLLWICIAALICLKPIKLKSATNNLPIYSHF